MGQATTSLGAAAQSCRCMNTAAAAAAAGRSQALSYLPPLPTHPPAECHPLVRPSNAVGNRHSESVLRPVHTLFDLPTCVCSEDGAPHGLPFEALGGLLADQAIHLLQQFYVSGNPQGVTSCWCGQSPGLLHGLFVASLMPCM